jgi:cytosine/creatinine deaminase
MRQDGALSEGAPADLVLFRARNYSELLSSAQHDRIVLRAGKPINRTL